MASEITSPPQAVSASARQAAKVKTYVNQQLEKTRRQVKAVDLIAGGLVLIAFVVGFLMLAALVDGWIWPLSRLARWACLVFLVVGCVVYTLTSIVPLLLKRINPDYAAKMIEEAKPSFQNSLLNYVSLRKKPEAIKPAVFDAVSRQAAANLATVPEDATVDRSKLIRLGFVLVGLTLFAVGYKVLSPKDPLQTVARIVFPGGKIAKPAVVKIEDVKPGDARVFFGEQLNVTAVVRGSHNPEDVRLMYSTLDGQHVEQSIVMTPDSASNRYRAALSMAGGGIQQSLRYQIVARDGVSPEYEVTVQPNPAITIESLVLQPPAYTKMRGRTLAGQGDVDAMEGTKVTVHAVANLPIKLAYIELLNEVRNPNQPIGEVDYDSRYRLATTAIEMQSEGTSATGSFQITLNTSREKPIASHYRIRFVSTDDDRNRQPNVYPIRIIPDLAPEIRFRNPDTRDIEIPVNGDFKVLLEANDLDFEIKSVNLNIDHQGSKLLDQRLETSSQDENRRVTASYRLRPSDLGLKEGDTAIFFGTAADNRMSPYSDQPDPNISRTENYSFKVTARDESAEKDPNQQNESNQPGEKGEGEKEDGDDADNDNSEKGEDEPGSKDPEESDDWTKENGNEPEKGEQSDDSDNTGSKKENPKENPGNQKQQESEKGNDENPETGEKGNSDSPEQSDDGNDPGSGGSATDQPEQTPEQQPEGGGQGNESQGKGDASTSENDATGNQGDSSTDSGDNSSTNEGGGSSSNDPSDGDPQFDPDSDANPKDGDGQKDDSLTTGAQEAVSDNASEGELMRKMLDHVENEQKEQPEKGEESDQNKTPDPKDGSDPNDDNSDKGAEGQSSENGNSGSETDKPGEAADPKDSKGEGEPGQPEENSDRDPSDTGNQESSQSENKTQNPQDPENADSSTGEPGSSDPNKGEPKEGETGNEESGAGEPGGTESETGDPGNDESGKDDSEQTESDKSEPEKGESGKGESDKDESGNGESDKGESGEGETEKGESSKGETGKGESDKGESDKGESDKGETGKGEPGKGESSEGEPGEGESGSGKSGKGEFGKGESGKQGSGKGEPGEGEMAEGDPGGAGSDEGGGNANKADQTGDQPSVDEKPPGGGDEKTGGNKPGSASAGTNPGAGSGDQLTSPNSKDPGGTGKGVSSAQGELLKREKANLEHAKKATDLVLNKLSEQKNDPDPELLRKLKMSKEDFQKFLDRWDEMKRKAETGDSSAQKKYEKELKSLGLTPQGGSNTVQQNQDKVEGLNEDGAVNEPPAELVPDFNSFIRDLSRVRDN